jgi:3-hydroxyacyl-[acyl-carrier-protein] dehydratase
MWHILENFHQSETGELRAGVRVPADSLWFSGHFPDAPVLPALAQLAMVRDLIRAAGDTAKQVVGFSRVKFRKMIRPGDRLEIIAAAKTAHAGAYGFRIESGREPVCSGTVTYRASVEKDA